MSPKKKKAKGAKLQAKAERRDSLANNGAKTPSSGVKSAKKAKDPKTPGVMRSSCANNGKDALNTQRYPSPFLTLCP
eukprot:8277187-Pyramimonas_sp.AAC.1